VSAPRSGRQGPNRLRSRREFRAAQEQGARVSLEHFVLVLYARAGANGGGPRLGIVASRRVGNAVRRNRAKRLTREAFRALGELFPDDIDVVAIVKKVPENLACVVAEWRAARAALSSRIQTARRARDATLGAR
jgi:ribonuclease P protein component